MRAGSAQIIAALLLVLNGAFAIAGETQRAVLYEENDAGPKGLQHEGSVVWRSEQVKSADGRDEIAIRADVDIPDRKLKMQMLLQRNLDPALSATHTVELSFNVPPDFPGGGIGNVPGLLLKISEKTTGEPLRALTVKVTDGRFLGGLSKVNLRQNLQLLRDRTWFDIPIGYTNQHRAILAIEKGDEGQRVFETTLDAWQKLGDNP
jgi:hypothetical protein